jgi:CPA1 family monovalent cation:H+ antiporter
VEILTIAVIGVLVVVLVNTAAPKLGVAAPLLLLALGVGASFLPFASEFTGVDPEWILGGILPPLLYSTAVNTPIMEFRRDFRTISTFSVILVIATAVIIGFLMTWLVPGLPLPLGIALGAILSPTDAVATSIVRRAGVSNRIVTVLEGEAMLNDASALVLLRSAVAAAAASVTLWEIALDFVYAVVVAVAVGWIVGQLNVWIRKRIHQEIPSVAMAIVIPFVAYIPCEHLNASGLVAAVVAGLVYGHHSAQKIDASVRLHEESVWRVIELLLESMVFLLMGLQLTQHIGQLHYAQRTLWEAVWLGAIAATVIILVRGIFVAFSIWRLSIIYRRHPHLRERLSELQQKLDDFDTEDITQYPHYQEALARGMHPAAQAARVNQVKKKLKRRINDLDYLAAERFNWKDGTVLVWAGMRGAVTLAAAQSLPFDIEYRPLLVTTAFIVAGGTLVLQGGLLPFLTRRLKVSGAPTDIRDQQMTDLRAELAAAAIAQLENPDLRRADGSEYSQGVRESAREHILINVHLAEIDYCQSSELRAEVNELRMALIEAQRDQLLQIRDEGQYPSRLLNIALKELDAEQIGTELKNPDFEDDE